MSTDAWDTTSRLAYQYSTGHGLIVRLDDAMRARIDAADLHDLAELNADCVTDGHYLCRTCRHASLERAGVWRS